MVTIPKMKLYLKVILVERKHKNISKLVSSSNAPSCTQVLKLTFAKSSKFIES